MRPAPSREPRLDAPAKTDRTVSRLAATPTSPHVPCRRAMASGTTTNASATPTCGSGALANSGVAAYRERGSFMRPRTHSRRAPRQGAPSFLAARRYHVECTSPCDPDLGARDVHLDVAWWRDVGTVRRCGISLAFGPRSPSEVNIFPAVKGGDFRRSRDLVQLTLRRVADAHPPRPATVCSTAV